MKIDLDNFPTNPTAKRMLRMVSPIYDRSYVGKWLYQVMGAVTETVSNTARGLELESHPETCTWALPYWEVAYGIYNPLPVTQGNIEERRRLVLKKRKYLGPMNPARIAQLVSEACGRPVEFIENVALNTFEIHVLPGDGEPELGKIISVVNEVKQSQEHFRTVFRNDIEVQLHMRQMSVVFPFPLTSEDLKAGTYPRPAWEAAVRPGTVIADTSDEYWMFRHIQAGTRPDVAHPGKVGAGGVVLDTEQQADSYGRPATGEAGTGKRAGQHPSPAWETAFEHAGVEMDAESAGGPYPRPGAGTRPNVSYTGRLSPTSAELLMDENGVIYPRTVSGTAPDRNVAGALSASGINYGTAGEAEAYLRVASGEKPDVMTLGSFDMPGISQKISGDAKGIVLKKCGAKKL